MGKPLSGRLSRMLAGNDVTRKATAYATIGSGEPSIEKQKVPTRATGGRVGDASSGDGETSAPRLDRAPRGGGKSGATVNVIVAKGPDNAAMPQPAPAAVAPPPPPRPPMMPPPGLAGGIPGGAPGMMPPANPGGMPPMKRGGRAFASGGRVGRAEGGGLHRRTIEDIVKPISPGPGEDDRRASGGRVGMTAGAGSGEGREQKIRLQKRGGS